MKKKIKMTSSSKKPKKVYPYPKTFVAYLAARDDMALIDGVYIDAIETEVMSVGGSVLNGMQEWDDFGTDDYLD
jgi:hypothetical protein